MPDLVSAAFPGKGIMQTELFTTPDIRQGEHAECGIAALAIVLGFHGVHVSLAELREQSESLLLGSTLRHLRKLAEREGFKATAHRLEPRNLKQHELPVIAHMQFIHFVVIERISDDGVLINDPSCGPMMITPEAFSRDFTGIVLKIQPQNPHRRGTAFSFTQALMAFFWPQRQTRVTFSKTDSPFSVLSCILIASLLCVFSGIAAPVGLDLFLQHDGQHRVAAIVLLLSALLTFFMAGVFNEASCLRGGRMVWNRLMRRLETAGHEHFLLARPQRTMALFHAVKDVQATEIVNAFQDVLWITMALLVGAWLQPLSVAPLAALSAAQGLCLLQPYRKRGGPIARLGLGKMPAESIDLDFLTNSNWYRIGRASDVLFNRLAGFHALKASAAIKAAEAWFGPDMRIAGLDFAKLALPILLLVHGQISATATAFALTLAAATCLMIPRLKPGLHGKPLKDALLSLSDLPPEAPPKQPPASAAAMVSVTQGCWSPTVNAPAVLEGVNLTVVSGHVLIVHGPPGCGLTTLARLAAGLLTPTHGAVAIDGRAILLDHQLFIIPGTLRHNLCFNRTDIDDATLLANLEAVGLLHTIQRRGGLDMMLKGDQPSLSGGQLRRLMIARALCHGADCLVLDEALDNIETDLARDILRTLKGRGLAVIITTKNTDLLECADQCLRLGEVQ
ncbi:ABC-type multidrug transport system fused ATPase/permease subunit [Agrobacterium vitis]|nr:ABC-type multidrug transport system fused ATPase/permease subunit [Agrobacterium vitis]MBE1439483.1 ABC-type multidrug transport system fused ATPase/permease subunit [Agrobacterium vitis]